MESININSLVNLAASALIFGAAVIPISLSIWSKAKDANEKDRIIRKTLNASSILLHLLAGVLSLFSGISLLVLSIFITGFILNCVIYIFDKNLNERLTVVALIFQGMILSFMFQLNLTEDILSLIKSLANQI